MAEQVPFEELPPAERSMDDVLAGVIRFTLGGRPFAMAVLPMGPHDRWQEELGESLRSSLASVPDGPDVVKRLAGAFTANKGKLLDALIAYDKAGDNVLPSKADIREIATQQDILAAIREVGAVGGDPLAVSVLSAADAKQRRPMALPGLTHGPGRSSGSRRNTDGRPRKSKKR